MNEFHVGQKVIVAGVNMQNKTHEAEVVKVGRTLVYIEEYGRQAVYRIDTGVRNDQYGHTWIRTKEQFQADSERAAAIVRLRDLGLVSAGYGALRCTTETLNSVCDLLEKDRP
jgi:hypothetical protein